jgi:ribosomal protein L4
MPKKVRQIAINSAWLAKFADKEVMVIESFGLGETPKTSTIVKFCEQMQIANSRILFGVSEPNKTLEMSIKNIPKTSLEHIARFNPYILLKNQHILLTKKALEELIKGRGGEIKSIDRRETYKKDN